jgi:acyl carrier protein
MPETIATRVMTVIAKAQHLDPGTVTADKSFADLGIDSLDGLSLVFALEEEFGVVIPDAQVKAFTTVTETIDGMTALVEQKRGAVAN